jgi:hypothetical protein
MEHRWGARTPCRFPIRVRTRGGLIAPGLLLEISISGGLLHLTAPLRSHSRVEIQILTPKRTLEAIVVRQTDVGVGLEWCELATAVVQELLEQCRSGSYAGIRLQPGLRKSES